MAKKILEQSNESGFGLSALNHKIMLRGMSINKITYLENSL